jgi:hypothetical protein
MSAESSNHPSVIVGKRLVAHLLSTGQTLKGREMNSSFVYILVLDEGTDHPRKCPLSWAQLSLAVNRAKLTLNRSSSEKATIHISPGGEVVAEFYKNHNNRVVRRALPRR